MSWSARSAPFWEYPYFTNYEIFVSIHSLYISYRNKYCIESLQRERGIGVENKLDLCKIQHFSDSASPTETASTFLCFISTSTTSLLLSNHHYTAIFNIIAFCLKDLEAKILFRVLGAIYPRCKWPGHVNLDINMRFFFYLLLFNLRYSETFSQIKIKIQLIHGSVQDLQKYFTNPIDVNL